MDTNIDKSPKGGNSPGSPEASRALGDIRSPGLSPGKPALTGSLQDKVGSAVDQARAGIADSASSASADLASDVEKMRADMASMKDTLAKFASELEGMARRQPLASLAVTLFVGIVIGMMGRSRS